MQAGLERVAALWWLLWARKPLPENPTSKISITISNLERRTA
jgi:hypothetical protein